ncbi:hypothetical protein K461DRAFT_85030 [Myriangium duriaei CBS 260.36]|uniref:Uncharacterized protein n=1 Tax=Myriangium duriaei CBS 260.36 TaxID=1168546 RepID=A0A9P4MK62_9PEZI|nr:hypothetical protein K461DRAFT_85030 [Myriangium duriaei CBS 260.36]
MRAADLPVKDPAWCGEAAIKATASADPVYCCWLVVRETVEAEWDSGLARPWLVRAVAVRICTAGLGGSEVGGNNTAGKFERSTCSSACVWHGAKAAGGLFVSSRRWEKRGEGQVDSSSTAKSQGGFGVFGCSGCCRGWPSVIGLALWLEHWGRAWMDLDAAPRDLAAFDVRCTRRSQSAIQLLHRPLRFLIRLYECCGPPILGSPCRAYSLTIIRRYVFFAGYNSPLSPALLLLHHPRPLFLQLVPRNSAWFTRVTNSRKPNCRPIKSAAGHQSLPTTHSPAEDVEDGFFQALPTPNSSFTST